jgi:hypothetical protein
MKETVGIEEMIQGSQAYKWTFAFTLDVPH